MTPFLLYIARGGLYLGLFYAFYLLVMRRTTFFRLNRMLLLLGSYLCLLLPLIRLRRVAAVAGMASEGPMMVAEEIEGAAAPTAFHAWLLALYIAGALFTLILFLLSFRKMVHLIRKGEAVEREDCHLVLLDEDIPSFSWERTVVMGRKDWVEHPAIFTHELMHVQCRHSRDLLLFLPFQLLFWWNPLVWIAREELRLLHEYEADEGVLQKGIDATEYQLLLVRKSVGEQRFTLSCGFQHTNLKNRIAMMIKPTSSGWMRWSYLALVPVMTVVMYACNAPKSDDNPVGEPFTEEAPATGDASYAVTVTDESVVQLHDESGETVPFQMVEVKPRFNGGDTQDFSLWVNTQLNYPDEAKKQGIQGRITLQFTVGADGIVRNARVLRGAHETLDAEALRVVSASPRWEPGRMNGEAVPVTYTFPVIFQLK